MAYRVRFYMDMNAREAMHVIELRSAPQGHPAYRRICQAMHRLIAERAGHRAIAAAMTFADHSRSEEHTSELQSRPHLVCRLLLEKKKKTASQTPIEASTAWRHSGVPHPPTP